MVFEMFVRCGVANVSAYSVVSDFESIDSSGGQHAL